MQKLIRSKQNPTTATHKDQIYSSPYYSGDVDNPTLQISKDKDGIPVIYDAFTHERGLDKPDEISILSHELLAPLTLIKGYTATLLHLNNAINEEQKDRYLRGIESAANKLIRLLENIRDLVQLEDTQSFP